ncbi:hypothetical protein B0T09DRAFT_102414 [Sordaria sp. MPI-SDFR-AT-0083]|nr:hypothetical protein B0T09DRAFT_102414 [Sordaria sp. MPI-SDFR-AT-0083]
MIREVGMNGLCREMGRNMGQPCCRLAAEGRVISPLAIVATMFYFRNSSAGRNRAESLQWPLEEASSVRRRILQPTACYGIWQGKGTDGKEGTNKRELNGMGRVASPCLCIRTGRQQNLLFVIIVIFSVCLISGFRLASVWHFQIWFWFRFWEGRKKELKERQQQKVSTTILDPP